MTARLNVRGELVAMVCNGCTGASEEAAEQWADDMLREHARQLAEKVRAMDVGVVYMAGRRVTDVDLIADLVNSEESTS
ncbi:hypothetical protein ACFVZM_06670 [Streptomyces sioyaensis]|uniref:hypothetical protein n=1 Tax=Streptomyces sioyaensis TaxID=67364 RepID=UPI003681F8F8